MMKTKVAIVAIGVAALGAAGVGTAFASAHSSSVRPVHTQVVEAPVTVTADDPNGPNDQVGDQTTSDAAGSEKASETAGASDAPGGFEGTSNADGQQEGEN